MASTTGWNIQIVEGNPGNNQSLNNNSGFNAFPVGFRIDIQNDGTFFSEGEAEIFWSSTEESTDGIVCRVLANSDNIIRTSLNEQYGISVRFVRD